MDKLPNYHRVEYIGYILKRKVYMAEQAITGVQILYTVNKHSPGFNHHHGQDYKLVIKLSSFKEETKDLYIKNW